MVLSDRDIRSHLEWGRALRDKPLIDPRPEDHRIQPASVDLILGTGFKTLWPGQTISLSNAKEVRTFGIAQDSPGYILRPGEFCLGTTRDWVNIPNDLVARVEGKSSLGRLGLAVHSTAGYIDPGFQGRITLEFTNTGPATIELEAGYPICQISFIKLSTTASRPYGHPDLKSKYQGQAEVTGSRYDG